MTSTAQKQKCFTTKLANTRLIGKAYSKCKVFKYVFALFFFTMSASFPGDTYAQVSKTDSLLTIYKEAQTTAQKRELLQRFKKQFANTDQKELDAYLKKQLHLSITLKDFDNLIYSHLNYYHDKVKAKQFAEATHFRDTLLLYKHQFKSRLSEADLYFLTGYLYAYDTSKNHDAYDAIQFLEKGIAIYKEEDKEHMLYYTYDTMYKLYSSIQNFEKALYYLKKAEYSPRNKIFNSPENKLMFEVRTVDLIRFNGLHKIAEKRSEKLLILAEELGYYTVAFTETMNRINDCLNAKDYSKIKQLQYAAAKYLKLNEEIQYQTLHEYTFSAHMVRYYCLIKDASNAEVYFNQFKIAQYKLANEHNIIDKNAFYTITYAYYYQITGRIREAIAICNEFLNNHSNNLFNSDRHEIQRALIDFYLEANLIPKAKKLYSKYSKIQDSLVHGSNKRFYAYYDLEFQTLKKEQKIIEQDNEIQQLEYQKKRSEDRFKRYIAYGCIVFLFFGFWGKSIRTKNKLKQKEIEDKLRQNDEELSNYMQALLKKSKEQEVLKTEVAKLMLNSTKDSNIELLTEMKNYKLLTKEDWLLFKNKFNKAYPYYFFKLKNSGFEFTNAEERLISLEKMGLSTEELANVLGISTESVLTARYRLRKKLKAPGTIQITVFIDEILKA